MDKTIAFTPQELRAVEPLLSDELLDRSGTRTAVPREMLLRFGAALTASEAVELTLPEREIWLLRELVPLGLKSSDGAALGYTLKLKLYNTLLELAAEEVLAREGLELAADGNDRRYKDIKKEQEAT